MMKVFMYICELFECMSVCLWYECVNVLIKREIMLLSEHERLIVYWNVGMNVKL